MFFNSWELWEKMTFVSDESSCHSIDQLANDTQVLGVCILIVFGIGYGKLLWRNRLVRKQEVVDEEKRVRIQQLRNSGQIIETPKGHDIPFGVRAIQSGVEVDGIWISRTNTPIPSELRSGNLRGSTSDSSTEPQSPTQATPKILRPGSIIGEAGARGGESSSSLLEHTDDTLRPDSQSNRKSYQPRKSSHLRYDKYGDYDEETLGRLEGTSQQKKKIQTHRPRGSHQIYIEADSSAADNERNSGTSSDSDASLTCTVPIQESKADYFSAPFESPTRQTSDPFATPMETPLSYRPPNARAIRESSWFDDSQAQPTWPTRSFPPFIAGELHVNKAVRKVNSGFEVLPAGTFGVPVEYKGKAVEQDEDTTIGRSANKLQKKGRNSLAGGPSYGMEQP